MIVIKKGDDGTMKAKKRLTVRMTNELNEQLTKESKIKGISKNAIILQKLWKAIEDEKKGELKHE